MPNLYFRLDAHSSTGEAIVEVWDSEQGMLVGVIYPTPSGIKFVSKFIRDRPNVVMIDRAEPPAVIVSVLA